MKEGASRAAEGALGGDGEDGGGAIRDGCGEAASAGGCRSWCVAAVTTWARGFVSLPTE